MNYDNTKMIRVFQTAGNILQDITEMSVPRGKFSASQLDSLRKAYEKINTVDPNSPAAKRMFELLDSMSKDQLKQVIDAKIKFLSKLAFRRFNRMQNPSKYPSDKFGEEVSEDSFTISEASEAIVKKGTKFKAGVPMWFHTTFKGLQKYPNQVVAGWKTELKTGSGMPGYITYGLHSDGLGKYTVYHLGSGQTKIVSKPLGVFDSPEEAMIFVEDDVLKESADDTKFADLTKEVLAKGTYLGHDKKFGRKWWDHKGYLYGMHPDGKHVFNNGSINTSMNQKIVRGLVKEEVNFSEEEGDNRNQLNEYYITTNADWLKWKTANYKISKEIARDFRLPSSSHIFWWGQETDSRSLGDNAAPKEILSLAMNLGRDVQKMTMRDRNGGVTWVVEIPKDVKSNKSHPLWKYLDPKTTHISYNILPSYTRGDF
jgi:hypothetical protein